MNPLVKAAYRSLPLKRELFTAIRAFGVPSSYRRMYFKGAFQLDIDASHSFRMNQHNRYGIETELFWHGLREGWETASLSIWMQLCRGARGLLDIGAAEGLYALTARCLNQEARVLAFEPLAQPHAELSDNVALNDFAVEIHETALSNFIGQAPFYTQAESSNEGSLQPTTTEGLASALVPVTTLAAIIEGRRLAHVDAMKIDVEGAEPEVLEGMGQHLSRFRPAMIIEILNDDVGRRVEQLVAGLDYAFFDVNDDRRKGPRTARRVQHIRKATCLNYALIPEDRVDAIHLP